MSHITNTVLMIRPVQFRMNEQTAVNNFYQKNSDTLPETVNAKATQEFDKFQIVLKGSQRLQHCHLLGFNLH